jgi:peptidoglycan/xylan/chitin deacetylase (PgdA/CDA1 family)
MRKWVLLVIYFVVIDCLSQISCTQANAGDLYDVALLYDSAQRRISDSNFCKITQFYGLQCNKIDLSQINLKDNLLKDETDNYYKGIAVSAYTLKSGLITRKQLEVLKEAINVGGLNVLVYDLCEDTNLGNYGIFRELMDNTIIGVTRTNDSTKDYIISNGMQNITREFTGITLKHPEAQEDFCIVLNSEAGNLDILVSSTDDFLNEYPIFVHYKKGKGSIFLLCNKQKRCLGEVQMRELYCPRCFSQIVPIMMFVRYVGGDECWHRNTDYANLTVDDPYLIEPYGNLSFKGLLAEMKKHNFHTTIAFIPWNYDRSEPEVVKLFIDNPDKFSLVPHGNNHDHYEFHDTVPLAEQERDIVESLNRMEKHKTLTDIPYGKVMIFPHGISPAKTFEFLKKYNFNMTVNAQDAPLGSTRSKDYNYGMEAANMDYGNFASIKRHSRKYNGYVFDLFVDRPVLLYTHHNFFSEGIGAFNSIAQDINDLAGEVKWESLRHIAEHLYMKKTNDDGTVDVKIYTNELILRNDTKSAKVYHIYKKESLNVPISKLTIDDIEKDYSVEKGVLKINCVMIRHFKQVVLSSVNEKAL